MSQPTWAYVPIGQSVPYGFAEEYTEEPRQYAVESDELKAYIVKQEAGIFDGYVAKLEQAKQNIADKDGMLAAMRTYTQTYNQLVEYYKTHTHNKSCREYLEDTNNKAILNMGIVMLEIHDSTKKLLI